MTHPHSHHHINSDTGHTPLPDTGTTRRSARSWGLLAGVTLAGLLLGAFLGTRVAALTISPPTVPTAPPPIGASFPVDADRYLPGVTVGLIAQEWLVKTNGWQCTTESKIDRLDLGSRFTSCYHPDDVQLHVYFFHDQDTQVRTIEAVCRHPVGTPLCQQLFQSIAVLCLKSQQNLRTPAEDWIRQNTDRDATTVIGTLRLFTNLDRHVLTIVPAE